MQGFAISGSGTSSSPYLIYTAADLVTFRNYVNNGSPSIYGKLMADIDLSSVCSASKGSWTPIGNGNPVTGSGYLYRGQFNGNYHTISGLYINGSAAYKGLFGTITGLVYRLTVSGTISVSNNTTGTYCYIGGVVGYNKGGRVASCNNNCVISGDISAAGGVVGMNEGSIYNCTNEANITGRGSIGGIVGEIEMGSSVEQCTNNGTITANRDAGGIIGYGRSLSIDEIEALGGLPNTTIINCINNGNIEGEGGGIISIMSEGYIVEQCVNNGTISANSCAGGITYGISGNSTISNCYNSGTININRFADFHVGGIAAMVYGTESYDESLDVWIDTTKPLHIQNCYNIGTINIPSSLGKSGGVYSRDDDISPLEIINSYCLNSASTSAGGGIFKDANAFQNGEVAYLLQQGQSSQYWGQTLGSDNSPIFSSDKSNKVYSETFIYNNETVFVKYRNENYTTSSFPTESELAEIGVTHGYYMDYFGATRNTSSRSIYNSTLYIYDIEGEGSATAPFLIHGAEDLVTLEKIVNGKKGNYDSSAKLTADIDLSSVCGETIGNWTPIGTGDYPYKGTFDGDGHKISNLYINSTTSFQGLFGDNYGTIKNLTISGYVRSTGTCVGGVVGCNEGHISNCTNLCSVSGAWTVGGIAGDSQGWDGNAEIEWETTITNCTNKGIINLTQNTNYTNYYGSIAGAIDDICTVSNCIDYKGIPFVGVSGGGEVIGCTHIALSTITFADANVKAICVANWDTNGDGELDEDEAAAVTSLGEVFKDNTTITSFDELQYFTGLTTIYAFSGCSGLTSITIPESVTSIGHDAFQNCSGLTSINIPESVTNIGYGAFDGCSGLIELNLPDNAALESGNADYTFRGCSNLVSLKLPNGITRLYPSTFSGCSSLQSLTIPASVTYIGEGTFYDCTSLKFLTIDDGTSDLDICFNYYVNSYTGYHAFSRCPLESVYLGRNIKNNYSTDKYGYAPFYNKKTLTSLTIGDNVTSIPTYLFAGCSALTLVTIPGSVTEIADYAFDGCTGLSELHLSEGLVCIRERAFDGCSGLTSVTIPNSVTSIGNYAFSSCSDLTSIVIPNSVTSIGRWAFQYCSGLTSIVVEAGNTKYDSRNNCNAIIETSSNTLIRGCENTVIPNGVTSIGSGAFNVCSGLTSITIPESVTSIGSYAFSGCSGLTSVTIPNNVTSIGSYAFSGCSGLTSVTIPNSVTSIGDDAFYNCSGLASVTIGNNVTSIGDEAFSGCSGLTSVTIGNSVTSIGSSAFQNCSGLTSVTIGSGVTSIGSWAFHNCSGLTSVTIPNSVTSIGSGAFYGCSGLTSITIPNSVKSIGSGAFWNCSSLTSVTCLAEDVPNTGSNVFRNVPQSTATLCVPAGSVDAYKAAEQWKEFGTIRGVRSGKCGTNVSFVLTDDYTLTISGNGYMYDYDDFWDYDESIRPWKDYSDQIRKVVVEDGVKNIGECAFYDCSGLTSITIPNSVTSIGAAAFGYCSSLTSITIPESVTSIGDGAFKNCSGLTKAEFASIESLCNISFGESDSNPLYYAHHLYIDGQEVKDVVIPEIVTIIGDYAFINCSDLTSVTIPESVTSIGQFAFCWCSGLTKAEFASIESLCNISFGSEYANPLCYANHLYIDGQEVTNVVIPNGVTSIGSWAFHNCSGLTSVTIPNSVTSIGYEAFRSCSNLTSVTCLAENVPTTGGSVFSGVPQSTATLYVPAGSVDAYKAASQWKDFNIESYKEEATGDIDGDGEIDVADIQHIINMIVGTEVSTSMADINGDDDVDIADIQAIINIIISNANVGAREMMPVSSQEEAPNADFVRYEQANNTIDVSLINNITYSAFQLKVALPRDVDITDVDFCNARMGDLSKYVKKVADGQYIIMGYSLDGSTIEGSEDVILTIQTSKPALQQVAITDVVFSTPKAVAHKLPVVEGQVTTVQDIVISSMKVVGNTISIYNSGSDTLLYIYSLDGRLVNKQVLNNGQNSFVLPKGQYVINKQKVFIGK